MKQAEDTKTVDMLDPAPPKRGRPVTGKAMTAAERKRKSRAKNGKIAIGLDLSEDVVAGLKNYVQFKGLTQDQAIEKLIRTQLLRKR